MAMQKILDPGWPPLTQGSCLVHGCGPMPRILHTCRRMASVSAGGVCVGGRISQQGSWRKPRDVVSQRLGQKPPPPLEGNRERMGAGK